MIITVHDALALLKEQEQTIQELKGFINGFSKDAVVPVQCKDCKYLIDHYGFMDDGYCKNMREKYYLKFKPEDDWFCADGERKD